MPALSVRVENVLRKLFPTEAAGVRRILLDDCGENLPLAQGAAHIERIQLGVLKMSAGDIDRLLGAVRMAQTDWRDVLMNSDFANDLQAHLRWADEIGA